MLRRTFLTLTALAVAAPLAARAGSATAHDFVFENIDGGEIRLADFAGRPVMVVNTASQCGFTYQYDGLQARYDRYRGQGLVVLAVPSDDFGGQEYATEDEVKHFCEVNFGLDLPMTTITKVRGRDRHPFYDWADQVLGASNAPRWNFHKYLIGPDGRAVAAFSTSIDPMSRPVKAAIEDLLG